ncbi:hypothetical protein [Burkholderia sp. Ac-20365]|uniref:hypothetical protein n=1 Tax=Burkholderia sp. Ac-20365 TaxID=2703897 RepID=UPI00197C8F1A|nr:hypothetical protein [Burkholderia sp. Ac-20365]MBN3761211.1 TrbI/VirB10 family protein [Burkholderia sp. Ac-20365]
MKWIALPLLIAVATIAHAERSAQIQPDLLTGQSFECASFVKPAVLLASRDDTPVNCDVTVDVLATVSHAVVIPRKSRLFGWKSGDRVEWTSWTTPGRFVVGDATLHGKAFASKIDPAADTFSIVVLRDLVVPTNARN